MGDYQNISLITGILGGLIGSYIYNTIKNNNMNISRQCPNVEQKLNELSNKQKQEMLQLQAYKTNINDISAQLKLDNKTLLEQRSITDHLFDSYITVRLHQTELYNRQNIRDNELGELISRIIDVEQTLISLKKDNVDLHKRIVYYLDSDQNTAMTSSIVEIN